MLRRNARGMLFSNGVIEEFIAAAPLAHRRVLNDLLEGEMRMRAIRKRERLMHTARFPAITSFENYNFRHIAFPENYSFEERRNLAFIRNAEGFVFHGKTKRGKTHRATAVGIAAIEAGYEVRFFTTAQLVMMLVKANDEGHLDALSKDIAKADLVIFDEFGSVPIDIGGTRLLCQTMSECYEQRSILITTTIEFSTWGTVLGEDKVAAALLDRIVHHNKACRVQRHKPSDGQCIDAWKPRENEKLSIF